MPPSAWVKWRSGKQRALCQIAVASRFLGGARRSSTSGLSSTGILTYHHVAKQVASGVTAVTPAGAALGILTGTEVDKLKVATGEYDRQIDKKIAQIQRTCGL